MNRPRLDTGSATDDTWVEDTLRKLDEIGALAPELSPEEQAREDSAIIHKLSQAYLASRARERKLLADVKKYLNTEQAEPSLDDPDHPEWEHALYVAEERVWDTVRELDR